MPEIDAFEYLDGLLGFDPSSNLGTSGRVTFINTPYASTVGTNAITTTATPARTSGRVAYETLRAEATRRLAEGLEVPMEFIVERDIDDEHRLPCPDSKHEVTGRGTEFQWHGVNNAVRKIERGDCVMVGERIWRVSGRLRPLYTGLVLLVKPIF